MTSQNNKESLARAITNMSTYASILANKHIPNAQQRTIFLQQTKDSVNQVKTLINQGSVTFDEGTKAIQKIQVTNMCAIKILDNASHIKKSNPHQDRSNTNQLENDQSDLKFTWGLQGGIRLGLSKLLGVKLDLDFGTQEVSLLTGREYANQSFIFSFDVAGFSFGLDASRNKEYSTFVLGKDSVLQILSGTDFQIKPAFSTPWNVSTKEFWKIDIGGSAYFGIEGTMDFSRGQHDD